MEYIKKEELIKGEIYKASNESLTYIMKATKNLYNVINIPSYNEFMKSGNFNGSYLTFINATSEEKHWLNTCIEQDKFITFEEVMKTFIPEYVEAIQQSDGYTIGKIYKTLSDSTKEWYRNIDDKNRENGWSYLNFKPSTKEAYDAQFIVKEEFVLPDIWCIKVTNENRDLINKLRKEKSLHCKNPIDYDYMTYSDFAGTSFIYGTEITFEQFKKYVLKEEIVEEKVIEPLPQFKIIETIETITKVENNEGNQFFIGDVVISLNGTVQTIESFDYNKAKTNIIAFTNKQSRLGNGIGIDKIEHYIEPKVEVEETLLEKAKRLYPVGTRVKTATGNDFEIIIKDQSKFRIESSNDITTTENYMIYLYCSYENEWAEIIN